MLIGNCQKVTNSHKYQTANQAYYFLRVRLEDGSVEQLMMTEHEFNRAKDRALKHPEDWVKLNAYK